MIYCMFLHIVKGHSVKLIEKFYEGHVSFKIISEPFENLLKSYEGHTAKAVIYMSLE